jgi:CBS domain-containing protein
MLVADVLRLKGAEVVTVLTTDTVASAVAKLAARRIGAVLVEDRWGNIEGIFSERDLVRKLTAAGAAVLQDEVKTHMTSPVLTCRSADRVDAALATMTLHKIRHIPVIDDGVLKGMISIGDLVKHRLDEKEIENSVLRDIARVHV